MSDFIHLFDRKSTFGITNVVSDCTDYINHALKSNKWADGGQ